MDKLYWRYIDEKEVTGSYGLAADEHFMLAVTQEDYPFPANLRLYNYADYSALCGRFQNLSAEIDLQKCSELGYDVGRRLTGGGAIIMGREQLGLCLTIDGAQIEYKNTRDLYRHFATPVIDALAQMGIHAGFKSKNDIEVEGKKIAGLGVHIDKAGGLQFHTSLLVDLNINDMLEVLRIPIQKYDDRIKIRAVNQRMTTVKKEANGHYGMEQVKQIIRESFRRYFGIFFVEKEVTETEKRAIAALEDARYKHPDWLYQFSPREDLSGMSLYKTPAGLLRTYIGLKGDTIKSVLITGDFMEAVPVLRDIEAQLKWSPLDAAYIGEIIRQAYERHKHSQRLLKQEDLLHAIMLAGRKAKVALEYHYNGSCYYPKQKADAL